MSISNATNKVSFSPSTATTTYPFTFPFFATSDIVVKVLVSGATSETTLTFAASPSSNSQFKVDATNNDTSQGGTVTIGGTGYGNGDTVVIERIVPLTQEYDLQEGASIDPTALNKALDRTVAQSQQIDDKTSKAISFPDTDADTVTYNVTESSTSRANKALGFDASGNITSLDLVSAGSIAGGSGIDITDNVITTKVDDSTLGFSGSTMIVKDSGITSSKISNGAIGFGKIGNEIILNTNLAADAVSTSKILDSTSKTDGVTFAKMQHISTDKVLGRLSAGEGDVEEVTVSEDLSGSIAAHTSLATAKAIKELPGLRVGRVIHIQGTAASNLADRIPADDTTPLITEGAEVCTINYTPTSTSNLIRMSFEGRIFNNNANQIMTVAFFEGSTCKQAFLFTQPSNGILNQSFSFEFNPAATSSTTYSVRIGRDSTDGSANKWGYSAASDANFNGLKHSPTLTIEEWNT